MKSIPKAILVGALLALTAPAFAEEAHHTGSDPAASQPPSPSSAQPATGMMMSDDMMPGGMMSMMGNMHQMMASKHIEGRIAFLKAELKITANQEPLWQTFADAIRTDARSMRDMAKQMQAMKAPGSLMERLDRHERMLNAHLDHLQRIEVALRPLYESLDDDQRRTADELVMPLAIGMM